MKARNAHNQQQTTHFANKYEQHFKPKTAHTPHPTTHPPLFVPKAHTPNLATQNPTTLALPLTTPPLHATRPHNSHPAPAPATSASVTIIQLAEMALASTIDMRDLSLFVEGTAATP
jgi:hypothetical protein